MNDRIDKMRKSIDALNDAGVRKTLFYPLAFASLKKSQGESVQMRRARAQAYILDNAPCVVLPHELIAGSMVGLCPLADSVPSGDEQREKAMIILEAYLQEKKEGGGIRKKNRNAIKTFEADFTGKKSRWALMSRVYHDASITYSELQTLIQEMSRRYRNEPDLEKYEIGRELERGFKIDYGKEVREEIDGLPWFAANHLSLNYAGLMNKGFDTLFRDLEEKKNKAEGEELAYYEAASITAAAASRFMSRYAVSLREAAVVQKGERGSELQKMADICETLSHQRAGSFREGVQFIWMLHIMASFLWGSALSFGRFDQYLEQLYTQDLEKGVLSRNEAKELLCCFWLKVNEPRMRTVQSMTIGGITPDGKDAANILTALCLEVVEEMKLPYPNVGVRINSKNPEWLYKSVVEAVSQGCGQPMIMADEVWINSLKKLGYADCYANDYYNMGCVEIMVPGKQPNWGVTDPIAFPMLYEEVFRKLLSKDISLPDFDCFKAAYLDELQAAVLEDRKEAAGKQADIPGKCFDPFASLMIDGCLEKGADMFQGGSELGTHWSFYAYGLGTAADAMAAVKKFVYDDKTMSIEEMAEMLRRDFREKEHIRAMLENRSPHYGNDLDEVDELANLILSEFNRMVFELNSLDDPDKYVSTLFGYFFHIYHGEITGATANGRRRGEAFSDSMGPSQGKDVTGPTKFLNSVLKLDHSLVTGGYALNLKINPDLVRAQSGKAALETLIRVYIEGKGPQVQINFVDAESLIKAKEEPDKYRNLIVRIGGYCEYFVNLDSSLQDEIIKRTVHGFA